jgi:hypothetical protein
VETTNDAGRNNPHEGVRELATLGILGDLEEPGYRTRQRVGRRMHWVMRRRPMRHPEHPGHDVDELVALSSPGEVFSQVQTR